MLPDVPESCSRASASLSSAPLLSLLVVLSAVCPCLSGIFSTFASPEVTTAGHQWVLSPYGSRDGERSLGLTEDIHGVLLPHSFFTWEGVYL